MLLGPSSPLPRTRWSIVVNICLFTVSSKGGHPGTGTRSSAILKTSGTGTRISRNSGTGPAIAELLVPVPGCHPTTVTRRKSHERLVYLLPNDRIDLLLKSSDSRSYLKGLVHLLPNDRIDLLLKKFRFKILS